MPGHKHQVELHPELKQSNHTEVCSLPELEQLLGCSRVRLMRVSNDGSAL